MQTSAKENLESDSFRRLLQISAEAMFISDREGRIIVANEAAERLFGYAPGELQWVPVEHLIPARFRAAHLNHREEFGRFPKGRTMGAGVEVSGQMKGGREFPAEVSLSPMADGRVLATVFDNSDRKQVEEALASEREFAENIIDTTQEPLVVLDANNHMVTANRAFCRLFRLSADEIVGRSFAQLCEQRWGFMALDNLYGELLSRRGVVEGFELEHDFPEIGNRILRINARKVLGTTGKQKFILLAIEDITERKRMEAEQRRIIHELESANEELKNFAYVVSHDLKAPLRAISSLADWIASDQMERLDEEGREHLRLLIQRTRRMDALIDGVLQYSRLARVREAMTRVDLNQLLAEVIDLLAPPAHIQVILRDPLPTLRIEKTRAQQVFQNLISNAIRYMDKPEGSITVGCEDQGDFWCFSVADNGAGIEQRHFNRIFQLFQTLNPRDRVESTGVGLAIIKKIADLYGGRVWLESTVGAGSTFFFTLPKTIRETSSPETMP